MSLDGGQRCASPCSFCGKTAAQCMDCDTLRLLQACIFGNFMQYTLNLRAQIAFGSIVMACYAKNSPILVNFRWLIKACNFSSLLDNTFVFGGGCNSLPAVFTLHIKCVGYEPASANPCSCIALCYAVLVGTADLV